MREVGEVIHVAGSGRVIVRLRGDAREGDILYDRKGARIAKVMELIGPVVGPYASAAQLTNNARKIAGRKLFAFEAGSAGGRKR